MTYRLPRSALIPHPISPCTGWDDKRTCYCLWLLSGFCRFIVKLSCLHSKSIPTVSSPHLTRRSSWESTCLWTEGHFLISLHHSPLHYSSHDKEAMATRIIIFLPSVQPWFYCVLSVLTAVKTPAELMINFQKFQIRSLQEVTHTVIKSKWF